MKCLCGISLKVVFLISPSDRSNREELDREVKATVENKARGLGLQGEFEGVPDYYGGNVQCTIRLLYTGDGTEPEVRLEPLQMTRSTHLARELGSLSVIALRDDKDGALVRKWATRKFILCGRAYVALPPKSGKVYLMETKENYGRIPQEWCGDQHRMSYDEYIRRNNPMDLNAKQVSCLARRYSSYSGSLSTAFREILDSSFPLSFDFHSSSGIQFREHTLHRRRM